MVLQIGCFNLCKFFTWGISFCYFFLHLNFFCTFFGITLTLYGEMWIVVSVCVLFSDTSLGFVLISDGEPISVLLCSLTLDSVTPSVGFVLACS